MLEQADVVGHTVAALCNGRRAVQNAAVYLAGVSLAADVEALIKTQIGGKLSEEAGKAFLDEYGKFDPIEKALDDVVSVVVTLYLACQRDKFPWWAQAVLDELDTTFIEKIECLDGRIVDKTG